MGTDSFLVPTSGRWRNCSFCLFVLGLNTMWTLDLMLDSNLGLLCDPDQHVEFQNVTLRL